MAESHDDDGHQHRHEPGPWDDETAEWYVEQWGEHPTNRMSVALAGILPGDVVLDIGCGSGAAVRAAAERAVRGSVYGVDPTPAMRRLAVEHSASHRGCDRIEFLEGDATHVPLEDESVDVALAINSLHHWEDVPAGLEETRRVLKPGGRLLVSDEYEEESDGEASGHESKWKDHEVIAGALAAAGFTEVTRSEHVEEDVRMSVVRATKPAFEEDP